MTESSVTATAVEDVTANTVLDYANTETQNIYRCVQVRRS